jgi:NADPH-dependent 2,4-dienoyl-CoA reductase/sulfur reductase-like enzyme/rhodanese-related sulfurtransferase
LPRHDEDFATDGNFTRATELRYKRLFDYFRPFSTVTQPKNIGSIKITQKVLSMKIVIVGGAAGGMSAALRARRLDEDAQITLIEQGKYLNYANSGIPSSVGGVIETDTFLIHQSAAGLRERFNIDMRENTELVSISKENHSILLKESNTNETYQLSYDKLILAQGAHPMPLPAPGIEGENVFRFQTMLDLHEIRDYVSSHWCKSAVIIGGGYVALKAVESLHNFGLRISIIHFQNRICQDFDPDMANMIQSELVKNRVQLYLNAKIQRIGIGAAEDSRIVTLVNGPSVPADLVIIATDLTPRTKVATQSGLECRDGVLVNEFMQTNDPDIYAVGDMAKTTSLISSTSKSLPLGGAASLQGRLAVDHIMKRAIPYCGHIGIYSCKVLTLTIAILGLSVEKLKEVGYHPQFVTVHVPDHTGYYPSTQQMTLRLAFQPASGRLLGAQILGRRGVDKRVDVLSVALQSGMTVFDLENLELSYAPEYGSAKDPVNVLGMVAANLLRGDLHTVTAAELEGRLDDCQIIDVQSPENFAQGHVPGALNVPIDTLRNRLACIDKRRLVVVYSRVGYHGYLAYRILVQLGYKVFNLDGGFKLCHEGGSRMGIASGKVS